MLLLFPLYFPIHTHRALSNTTFDIHTVRVHESYTSYDIDITTFNLKEMYLCYAQGQGGCLWFLLPSNDDSSHDMT